MSKEKEKEKEETKKEKEAETWDGPLSRYNTYPSDKTPKQCSEAIEETLTKMEKEELVDWEMDGFNVFGRMYHKFDMSEFMVNVYRSSDNQYQSVIEIRRSSGDTFVHDEFFRRISKHLQDRQMLEHKDCEHHQHPLDFDLSFELDSCFSSSSSSSSSSSPFDYLTQDLSPDLVLLASSSPPVSQPQSFADHRNDDDTVSTATTANSADNAVDIASDKTSVEQFAFELIEVVTDRWSYRE
ncbi:hypothetical protein RFI_39616, partial [Reticulomyxa filosa]